MNAFFKFFFSLVSNDQTHTLTCARQLYGTLCECLEDAGTCLLNFY